MTPKEQCIEWLDNETVLVERDFLAAPKKRYKLIEICNGLVGLRCFEEGVDPAVVFLSFEPVVERFKPKPLLERAKRLLVPGSIWEVNGRRRIVTTGPGALPSSGEPLSAAYYLRYRSPPDLVTRMVASATVIQFWTYVGQQAPCQLHAGCDLEDGHDGQCCRFRPNGEIINLRKQRERNLVSGPKKAGDMELYLDGSKIGTVDNVVPVFVPPDVVEPAAEVIAGEAPACRICGEPNSEPNFIGYAIDKAPCPACRSTQHKAHTLAHLPGSIRHLVDALGSADELTPLLIMAEDIARAALDVARSGRLDPGELEMVADDLRNALAAGAEATGAGFCCRRDARCAQRLDIAVAAADATLRAAVRAKPPVPAPKPPPETRPCPIVCDHGWDEPDVGWTSGAMPARPRSDDRNRNEKHD